MGLFDRLRKKQDISDAAESDAHFSSRQEEGKADAKAEKKADKKTAKTSEKKAAKKGEQAAAPKVKGDVLLHPIITEKNTDNGTYAFAVADHANKQEIKKAIEQSYGEKPSKVNIMNVGGKSVRWYGKQGKRKDWKKAIVRFPAGKTINVYDA